MVASLTISFIVRNTSVIGWPFLLAIKVLKDGAFLPFLIAGIAIFIPMMVISTVMDSWYFGWNDFPVITPLNFLKLNVGDSLSNYFGTEPVHYFFSFVIPQYFIVACPVVSISFYVYLKDTVVNKREVPYIWIIVFSYLAVYSSIKHKEVRFILPTIPFMCLMLGYTLSKATKVSSGFVSKLMKLYILVFLVVEVGFGYLYTYHKFKLWEPMAYLQTIPHAPHSVYTLSVDMPYFTWTHRQTYVGYDGQPL
jgi:GPI mannosyltransferase 3